MKDYPIRPVPFTDVVFEDAFWRPRLGTNRTVTLPYVLERCRDTGRLDNFRKAAGRMPGRHEGLRFDDSDVYKAIEGASYSLRLHPDPELERQLDEIIELIAAAQEPDGYLFTERTIDGDDVDADEVGATRWSNLRIGHELYDLGHLFEAAVAHHRATRKRSLLDVALRSADLLDRVFGPEEGKRRDVPGHQEVEIGLAKLYRVTDEERYLRLAAFFLDERGRPHGRELYEDFGLPGYMQDHLPVTEQREAVGHAVRATYMYSAMADVAALAGRRDYLPALDAIWENVVGRKTYLTGGIGSRHHGEAFGEDYELPDLTAYNETCAAIGSVMWNHRMFLLHGHARYLDVLERTLYNGLLSGVSLEGNAFFYPNPLESDGEYAFNMEGAATRSPWFHCSCCPTNAVRFFPSLPGYAYACSYDTVYVNLFVQGSATVRLPDGEVTVRQRTRYPWDGAVEVTVGVRRPTELTLALRLPGWARGRPVPSDLYRYLEDGGGAGPDGGPTLDGEPVTADEDGFARLTRRWEGEETVRLELPMPVREVASHPAVGKEPERVAVERGPLVYCAEGADHGGDVPDLEPDGGYRVEPAPDLLGGVHVIRRGGATLIPYYAWSHRGANAMRVWLRRREREAAPA